MVLTFVEYDSDGVPASSLTALTAARGIAAELDESVDAVVFGPNEPPLAVLAAYGVATVHQLEAEVLADFSPERWGESLCQLISSLEPSSVVAASADVTNEVMAQAAARADLPLATECLTIATGPQWQLTRIRGGGVLLEDAELEASVKLVTVAGAFVDPAEAEADGKAELKAFTPHLDGVVATRLVERTTRAEGVGLATARVVVSGGRGVGSAEGFASLEKLADLLGGAVGCSRVATNNGWRPHSDQVGQTGTKIAPDLYIACGISGATQHWVGCMDAKAILAINIDEQAPLVTRATYAVVGDVHEVLEAVIEEVEKRVGTARQP